MFIPAQISSANSQALVSLTEVVGAFSHALDLTEGQPEGHCLRAAWIGCAVGRAIGLDDQDLYDLRHCILLKDLGCSSNAARICELYLADDRRFKHDYKFVGDGIADALKFVFSRTGRDAPLPRRAKAIGNILRNGPRIARELIATRCSRGAEIAQQLRMPECVVAGIYSLDEHWDGGGKAEGLAGEAIPLFSRIALLAQVADVFHHNAGAGAVRGEIARRCGSWFDPALVDAFLAISGEAFWADLRSPLLELRLQALAPTERLELVDEDYLDDIASAFGSVVDAKSPYTAGHSVRVADYVERMAVAVGFDEGRRRWLKRGALLHDIGKLGVSNAILDKPGSLSDIEWREMRDHAAHTQAILGRLTVFEDLAPIASAHHERLDGTGYPLKLGAREIPMETRIITACDFFDALTADRPYRGAMPAADALEIMTEVEGQAVDPDCLAALRSIAKETAMA